MTRVGIICPRCSPMPDGRYSPMPPAGPLQSCCKDCGGPGEQVVIDRDRPTLPVFVELEVTTDPPFGWYERQSGIFAGATISDDGVHRYHLWRWLTCEKISDPRSVVFVMLNPSTADHRVDDQTIRKCMGFARRWGFHRIDVVNLFSYRTKSPRELAAAGWPNGPRADEWLRHVLQQPFVKRVVVAWGGHARRARERVEDVAAMIVSAGHVPMALQINDDGSPAHPCYLPYEVVTEIWPKIHRRGAPR